MNSCISCMVIGDFYVLLNEKTPPPRTKKIREEDKSLIPFCLTDIKLVLV